MDAVLGLSVTPSAVGLVLVQGQDADGATMDRDGFDVVARGASSAAQTCERAAAAVLRSEAIAATHGHRLHSIGVTWSDDANTEASLLLKSLTDSGFDNVVPVRMPEATQALARGIAEVIGYDTTAVCVLEPQTVISLIVHLGDGAVQTSVNHRIETEEDLIRWLSTLFTRADWQPQALVMVGSGGDDELMPVLEDALSVPVFAPAEAQLALARGAALASTQNVDLGLAGDGQRLEGLEGLEGLSGLEDVTGRPNIGHRPAVAPRRRQLAQVGPLAMLVAGALTFTVSASVAVSLQMAPRRVAATPEPQAAAKTSPEPAAALTHLPPPSQRTAPTPVMLPAPESAAAPVPAAPPPVYSEAPVELPDAAPDAQGPPADAVPPDAAAAPSGGAPPEAAPSPPPTPADQTPAPVEPSPTERPGIMTRIRDRLHGIHDDATPSGPDAAPAQDPAQAPQPPAPAG